jgi:hypothetical protein
MRRGAREGGPLSNKYMLFNVIGVEGHEVSSLSHTPPLTYAGVDQHS